jgi:hypothetical protein
MRPLARVRRIALFEREVRERLSGTALDLILGQAAVISEGQRSTRAGMPAYFGSTMLTIDLPSMASLLREPCDAGCAARLATEMQTDPAAVERLKAIAAREAERVSGMRPKAISTEVKVRSQGSRVFVDVDVEASF